MRPRWKAFGLLSAALFILILVMFSYIGAMGYFELDKEEVSLHPEYREGMELQVENSEGSIEITGWDKDNITITGIKKTFFGKKYFDNIELKAQTVGEVLKISVERENNREWVWMNIDVHVPRKMKLHKVDSENGDIRIFDMVGDIEVSAGNGNIRVEGLTGNASINADNGEIRLVESRGYFNIDNSNGAIYVRDVDNLISAESENGWIHVHEIDRIGSISANNGEVWVKNSVYVERIDVDNGLVLVDVDGLSPEGMRINVENGEIDVTIPHGLPMNVTLETTNGEVKLRNIIGAKGPDDYKEGELNGGGPEVMIKLDNGDIFFRGG